MIDFFTPIQVSSQKIGQDQRYEIQKYQNDPFMPTPVKIESIGDHRRKIIQWLKNMPVASRINKLTFTNKQFACLMIGMFERIEDQSRQCLREFSISFCPKQGFKINEERYIRKANTSLLEAEQKLINSIIIVNRYSRFDSVTVDWALASDIGHLFQLFDTIQNGISHELTASNYQNYLNQDNPHVMFYNPLDHDGSITKSLGTWFVEVIKKNICVQYFKECEEKNMDQTQKNFQKLTEESSNIANRKNQITEIFKEKSKEFKRYWKNLSPAQRQTFIEKILSNDIREILSEYRQIIKVSNQSFPNIKYSHPHHIKHFIENLVAKDGEYLLNELVFTRIYDASFEIATYKYEIMIEIQNQIEKKKREENFLIMRKKINKGLKAIKSGQTHKGNHEKIFTAESQEKSPRLQKQKKHSISEGSQKSNQTAKEKSHSQHILSQIQILHASTNSVNLVKRKKKKAKKTLKKDSSFQGCRQMSETTNDQDEDQTEGKQTMLEIYSEENRRVQAQIQLTKVLKQFTQRISTWNKYQQIALNRVANLLQSYNLSYQVFGSFANGLAIPTSDIDISIDPTIIHYFYGSFCSYRQKIIMALQFLQSCFQQMNWATNFNLITTASVPVLAFEIDLSVVYGNPKDLYYNVAKNKKGPKICVDLTIEPFANMTKEVVPHLGFDSTLLVRQWTSQYHNLGELIKLCKHILTKEKLNKSFTGGLSSYALSTMLYSFLKADQSRKQKSIPTLFTQFCEFIINFDQNYTVIEMSNTGPFQNRQVQKLTILNYLNGKNLTQNCYRFESIKQLFKKVKEGLEIGGLNNKQYGKQIRSIFLQ